MNTEIPIESVILNQHRRFIIIATATLGVLGTGGLSVPLIKFMNSSMGAPVQIDVSRLQPGEQITVLWRGKPVWVLRRTPVNIRDLKQPSLLCQKNLRMLVSSTALSKQKTSLCFVRHT